MICLSHKCNEINKMDNLCSFNYFNFQKKLDQKIGNTSLFPRFACLTRVSFSKCNAMRKFGSENGTCKFICSSFFSNTIVFLHLSSPFEESSANENLKARNPHCLYFPMKLNTLEKNIVALISFFRR